MLMFFASDVVVSKGYQARPDYHRQAHADA